MAGNKKGDGMDHLIAFLQKREGIDKTLKLIRYTSRLVAAVAPKDSEAYRRYSALEKSIGVSRKAYRFGKFLQAYNNLRKSRAIGPTALLELVAYGGEGVYYFIEQFVWLVKAGALDKSNEEELSSISALAEMAGYVANIWLSMIKIRAIDKECQAVRLKLEKEGSSSSSNSQAVSATAGQLQGQLSSLASARRVKVLAIVQDLADSTLALNDIRGGRDKVLSHPVTLAVAGLISGVISAHKNWYS